MQLKLYSESIPLNPAFVGSPRQVYASPSYKNDLVNKITAGSVAAVVGADLNGNASHIFTPKVDRNFDGAPEKVVGNANDSKGEFSLRVVPVDKINYFVTIEAKANSEASNRAPEELTEELLRGTAWDGAKDLHVTFWPTLVALFHGKEVPYDSVISSEEWPRSGNTALRTANGWWPTRSPVTSRALSAISSTS